jgi:hypothetical protein
MAAEVSHNLEVPIMGAQVRQCRSVFGDRLAASERQALTQPDL